MVDSARHCVRQQARADASTDLASILARGIRRLAERSALAEPEVADFAEFAPQSGHYRVDERRDSCLNGPRVYSPESAENGGLL